jgi:hypothetical protein
MQIYNASDFAFKYQLSTELFNIWNNLVIPARLLNATVWIAGGAVRRTISKEKLNSDIDLFFNSLESVNKFRESIKDLIVSSKENQHNIQIKLLLDKKEYLFQLITIRYYNGPEEVINSFDYTICQFVYDGEKIYCGDYALWDLGRKRLVVNQITYPIASLRRLLKYAEQGFFACDGCLNELLLSVADNPELLNNNIKYID